MALAIWNESPLCVSVVHGGVFKVHEPYRVRVTYGVTDVSNCLPAPEQTMGIVKMSAPPIPSCMVYLTPGQTQAYKLITIII